MRRRDLRCGIGACVPAGVYANVAQPGGGVPFLVFPLWVERLRRVLEFVELHGRFHRHSLPGAGTWSRIRCLRRLILVVTLLSEMPSTSAISRVLRSSR